MSNKRNVYFELINSNGWLIFILFFISSHFLFYLDLEFVNTDLVYALHLEDISQEKYSNYNEFVADFEDDLAELELDDDEVFNWGGIFWDSVIIIISFIFSVPIVAGLFILGFLFDRKYEQIKYAEVFKIIMLANFVFLLPSLISIFWFMVVETNYAFQDLIDFKPFYLISLFDKESLPTWSIGIINLINMYEVLFVLLVTFGLSITYSFKFKDMLSKVILFYASGLLFWKVIWIYIGSTIG